MTNVNTAALREIDHLDARTIAEHSREYSNLARCYLDNTDRLAALEAGLEQALHDPENQPSQYGTVPLAMYQALEARIAALEAGMRGLVESSQTVTAGCCEFEHGEYCTEVWSADSVDTENNKYVLIPADELSALLTRPADGGE